MRGRLADAASLVAAVLYYAGKALVWLIVAVLLGGIVVLVFQRSHNGLEALLALGGLAFIGWLYWGEYL